MTVLALAFLAQLAVAARPVTPVLAFPDPALDDTAAYRGYQTRFFRDAARNTLQIYIDQRSARVVHLLADADNASVGFTARDASGHTAALDWGAPGATISARGRTRRFMHDLRAHTSIVHVGSFVLGSMRVERDLQYFQHVGDAFRRIPYAIEDVDHLIAALDSVPSDIRRQHLARLRARTLPELQARLHPRATLRNAGGRWTARVVQVTLDARDTLTLELSVNAAEASASQAGDSISFMTRRAGDLALRVAVTTTARPLTPLTRAQIFTPDFLAFLDATRSRGAAVAPTDTAAIRARRMERQVSGVELLVSREKLMAGLPTYATYFGRDMLMTALMMRPIWQHQAQEAVIATALRKLGPHGDISHEEALGDQAVRESAGEYARLITQWRAASQRQDRAAAAALLARADTVLRTMRVPRENYHMIDDEYQFAIVVARWITDPTVPASVKQSFLRDASDGGGTRAERLLKELALIAELTAPYAANPIASNLIAFSRGEPLGWGSASWRDSGAGYAGGRYAMDINAIWVPHALGSIGEILSAMRELGISTARATADSSPLARFVRTPSTLQQAITTWRGASKHFLVQRSADQVRTAVQARLAAMPPEEQAWWQSRSTTASSLTDSLTMLAVSLDSNGAPIAVANTDPATQLFLGGVGAPSADDASEVLRTVRLFARPYPAGLFVDRIGPVVSNDAYAPPTVWNYFVKDPYHGPRVVWGREVNLFLLGVAGQIARSQHSGDATSSSYVAELQSALDKVRTAVEESGFHTELWSYGFDQGQLRAKRYGSGGDIQLWSTTDLAVQYVLSKSRR